VGIRPAKDAGMYIRPDARGVTVGLLGKLLGLWRENHLRQVSQLEMKRPQTIDTTGPWPFLFLTGPHWWWRPYHNVGAGACTGWGGPCPVAQKRPTPESPLV